MISVFVAELTTERELKLMPATMLDITMELMAPPVMLNVPVALLTVALMVMP